MATIKADMVIQHAKIYTCAITCEEIAQGKRDFPVIEDGGVAVLNGKIVYVGAADDVNDMIGEGTEVIDATGQIMTPGFIETHCHPIMAGATIVEEVDLLGITTQAECLRMLGERAANTPDGVTTGSVEQLFVRELTDQEIGTMVDDMVDDSDERFCVNRLVLFERGNKGNARAFERVVFHVIIDFAFAFPPKPSGSCATRGCWRRGRCLSGSRSPSHRALHFCFVGS